MDPEAEPELIKELVGEVDISDVRRRRLNVEVEVVGDFECRNEFVGDEGDIAREARKVLVCGE
jgi:hypothetical protein